jgi:hypothetical protein
VSRPRPERLYFYAADSGVEPDAAIVPWTKQGSQVPNFVDDGLELVDTSAVEVLTYRQALAPADSSVRGPARYTDDIAVQSFVRGITTAPAWGSGASTIGLFIYDGLRKLALSIGSTLQLINPDTGVIHAVVDSNHPWLVGLHYELRKVGSARWSVFVSGRLVYELPYDAAPLTPPAVAGAFPARAGFGILNQAGFGRAIFDLTEVSLNQALPPQWKVDRWFNVMPPTIAGRWTTTARAALRTIIGLVEEGDRPIEEAWRAITAERLDFERFFAEAAVRTPDDEKTPWVELGGAQITGLVRQRVRLDTAGGIDVGYRAEFASFVGPSTRETTASVKVVVREYTPDASGRVGPQIRVRDGARVVYATLFEYPVGSGSGSVVWALTSGFVVPADPVLLQGHYRWRIDPYQEHTVEVQVLGDHQILLLVNRQVVDRMPYTDATVDGSAPSVRIGQQGSAPASASCLFDLSELLAVRRFTDLKRRPVFEQNLLERLVFVSGCDRNDELDTWARHHWEMEQLRGTVIGAETEMRRLACCEDVRMLADQTYGGWVLESSFPETTPIFLELDGVITDAILEFCREAPNFSDQQLADLAARYLVPLSVEEMEFSIARIARTTGATFAPGPPGVTRIPIDDVKPFTAGDAISIRNNANTTKEDTTILVVLATALDVEELDNGYGINSVVRLVLATT